MNKDEKVIFYVQVYYSVVKTCVSNIIIYHQLHQKLILLNV